jgi:Tol biopolymer transport system component
MTTRRDLWLVDVASGAGRQITFGPADTSTAIWSPDGKSVVYGSELNGVREMYRKAVDGSTSEELLLSSPGFSVNAESWSADGRFLSYTSVKPGQNHDLFVLPMTGKTRNPVTFVATRGLDGWSAFSPNGRFLAYMSNETGKEHVYVREVLPDGAPGPGRWQISTDDGFTPKWRADGKELYFLSDTNLMAVDVETSGPAFRAGTPKPLGVTSEMAIWGLNHFAVAREGQRFLFAVIVQPPEPIRVLVNGLRLDR